MGFWEGVFGVFVKTAERLADSVTSEMKDEDAPECMCSSGWGDHCPVHGGNDKKDKNHGCSGRGLGRG